MMSDRLNEAQEALELWDKHGFDWKEARNRYKSTMAVVRAYRDLVNGERVGPDYEAATQAFFDAVGEWLDTPPTDFVKFPLLSQEQTTAYLIRKGCEAAVVAAIGDRLLVDPPTEED